VMIPSKRREAARWNARADGAVADACLRNVAMDAGGAATREPTLAARKHFRQAFADDSIDREVIRVAMCKTVI